MEKIFTKDELVELGKLLDKRYGSKLGDERFFLSADENDSYLFIKLTLENPAETFSYPMEFAVDFGQEGVASAAEAKDLLVDFIGLYLDKYFRSGRELILPLDFTGYEFEGRTVYARGDVRNPKLDRMADEIIAGGVAVDPDDPKFKL
ncbi:MAG: hypothetical protein FJ088_13935 [Deltaproteobacteria bacterium]|nr:hypothetical protein [Deltaproteobacteria bacterium]